MHQVRVGPSAFSFLRQRRECICLSNHGPMNIQASRFRNLPRCCSMELHYRVSAYRFPMYPDLHGIQGLRDVPEHVCRSSIYRLPCDPRKCCSHRVMRASSMARWPKVRIKAARSRARSANTFRIRGWSISFSKALHGVCGERLDQCLRIIAAELAQQ